MGRAPVRMKPCFVQVGARTVALVLPTSARRMHAGGLLHHSGIKAPFHNCGFLHRAESEDYARTPQAFLNFFIAQTAPNRLRNGTQALFL